MTAVPSDGEATKQATDSVMMEGSLSSRRDFDALMSWLSTFPRMEGLCDGHSDVDVLSRDEDFAM